jgi:cob(I)alamin adenosyltransferase
MSPFYTRKGDDGTTGLLGDGRVPKYHPRMEALGALDESTAALGLARATTIVPATRALLLEVQRDLYKLMAEVAATPKNADQFHAIDALRIGWLEQQADSLSERTEIPAEFILPGETPAGGAISLARAVVRRAERHVAALLDQGEITNGELLRYLNRLSSLCFILELVENQAAGVTTNTAKK